MTIPRAGAIGCAVAYGYEAEAVGDVFVVEDGGVFGYFDQVDGERRDLGDHYASEGVGDGCVGFAQDEFYFGWLDR